MKLIAKYLEFHRALVLFHLLFWFKLKFQTFFDFISALYDDFKIFHDRWILISTFRVLSPEDRWNAWTIITTFLSFFAQRHPRRRQVVRKRQRHRLVYGKIYNWYMLVVQQQQEHRYGRLWGICCLHLPGSFVRLV